MKNPLKRRQAMIADQFTVVMDIQMRMKLNRKINALVQGDVGCGKSIVAFLAAASMAENGYQPLHLVQTMPSGREPVQMLVTNNHRACFTHIRKQKEIDQRIGLFYN